MPREPELDDPPTRAHFRGDANLSVRNTRDILTSIAMAHRHLFTTRRSLRFPIQAHDIHERVPSTPSADILGQFDHPLKYVITSRRFRCTRNGILRYRTIWIASLALLLPLPMVAEHIRRARSAQPQTPAQAYVGPGQSDARLGQDRRGPMLHLPDHQQFDNVYSLQLVHALGGHWTETLFLALFQRVNCPPSWMSTQPRRTPVNLVRRYWCYFCSAGPDLSSLCMGPRPPLGF
ncbi:hypothetical protein LIA77_05777 [Sarocladium implicatum]|nr:hypothetical protein LIA77_05777 [Sarocladium implicatum]